MLSVFSNRFPRMDPELSALINERSENPEDYNPEEHCIKLKTDVDKLRELMRSTLSSKRSWNYGVDGYSASIFRGSNNVNYQSDVNNVTVLLTHGEDIHNQISIDGEELRVGYGKKADGSDDMIWNKINLEHIKKYPQRFSREEIDSTRVVLDNATYAINELRFMQQMQHMKKIGSIVLDKVVDNSEVLVA